MISWVRLGSFSQLILGRFGDLSLLESENYGFGFVFRTRLARTRIFRDKSRAINNMPFWVRLRTVIGVAGAPAASGPVPGRARLTPGQLCAPPIRFALSNQVHCHSRVGGNNHRPDVRLHRSINALTTHPLARGCEKPGSAGVRRPSMPSPRGPSPVNLSINQQHSGFS